MKLLIIKTGEVKEVPDGYATNYLLPKKLALPATHGVVTAFKTEQAARSEKRARSAEHAYADKALLESGQLLVHGRTNTSGKLFGGIGPKELADLILKKKKLHIPPSHIVIKKHIKTLGTFQATVALNAGLHATITINVQPSDES